ncbi:unnamed protein product, partial [Phaeothamnion confervicola]
IYQKAKESSNVGNPVVMAEEKCDFPYEPEDRAGVISFQDRSEVLDATRNARGHENKMKVLLTEKIRKHIGRESLYRLFRLVLPEAGKGKNGAKEKVIAKVIADRLNLRDEDATRLRNYTEGDKNKQYTGDFARTLQDVLEQQHRTMGRLSGTITVGDINKRLGKLEKVSRGRQDREREVWFYQTIEDLTPLHGEPRLDADTCVCSDGSVCQCVRGKVDLRAEL